MPNPIDSHIAALEDRLQEFRRTRQVLQDNQATERTNLAKRHEEELAAHAQEHKTAVIEGQLDLLYGLRDELEEQPGVLAPLGEGMPQLPKWTSLRYQFKQQGVAVFHFLLESYDRMSSNQTIIENFIAQGYLDVWSGLASSIPQQITRFHRAGLIEGRTFDGCGGAMLWRVSSKGLEELKKLGSPFAVWAEFISEAEDEFNETKMLPLTEAVAS